MAKRTQVIRWVMTLATVLVLVALAWQCIDIYLVGNSPANLGRLWRIPLPRLQRGDCGGPICGPSGR